MTAVASIGIDPGLTGAVAMIVRSSAGMNIPTVMDMPTAVVSGGSVKRGIDPANLAEILRDMMLVADRAPITVVIERVNAMPMQGVSSVFSLGDSYGVTRGVVAALGLSTQLVLPAVWKRRAGIAGKDKDAARSAAIQLYPQLAKQLSRKCDHGRAEAVLLAHSALSP